MLISESSSNTKMELSEKSLSPRFYSDQYMPACSYAGIPKTKYDVRRRYRSKSLSMLEREKLCPGEIRRIRERLLRTNSHVEPSALRKFSRSQKMTLLSLAIVDFLSFCSMSIMAPFFPKEASEKGLSQLESGFVFSFYALVMFITSPIFGKILPKMGAKFLFISGIFVAGACNLVFGMLEFVEDYTFFITYCFIIRGLEALGASAFSTASYVFVVNSFPNHIGSVLGILESFVGFGMSIGPALGGILYSIGGFDLPFVVLGIIMILAVPINMYLLPVIEDCNFSGKNNSMWSLIKIPAVFMTSLVVIAVSSTWSFLDPTLEPHLRQFDLTPERIGLIFLLFSALYGIFSPVWGLLADKCVNHWLMMVWGLFQCTICLLLLGPCPYIPFLYPSVWLNVLSLSILGISVALALLPTFQGVLRSAIDYGWSDNLGTYSMVAGVWSCMYSLGEVIGPSIGGLFLQSYGFPIAASIMAAINFILAIITGLYFSTKTCLYKPHNNGSETEMTTSNSFYDSYSENTPLLMSLVENSNTSDSYTKEKIKYFENYRKTDSGYDELNHNQITGVRGTICITSKGASEI